MAKDFMGSRPPPLTITTETVVVGKDVYIKADSLLNIYVETKKKYETRDVMRIHALCGFFEGLVKEAVERSHE